jgi:hypothetical protein
MRGQLIINQILESVNHEDPATYKNEINVKLNIINFCEILLDQR